MYLFFQLSKILKRFYQAMDRLKWIFSDFCQNVDQQICYDSDSFDQVPISCSLEELRQISYFWVAQFYINYSDSYTQIIYLINIQLYKYMGALQKYNLSHEEESNKSKATPFREIVTYRPDRFTLRDGYLASPTSQQLFNSGGKCKSLIIYHKFGCIKWEGNIDLSHLKQSLAQTVIIQHRQIEVYCHDYGKPSLGQELNRPCIARLYTNESLELNYLRKICRNNGTSVASCHPQLGYFEVRIPHFTKYKFSDFDESNKKKEEENLVRQQVVGNRSLIVQISNQAGVIEQESKACDLSNSFEMAQQSSKNSLVSSNFEQSSSRNLPDKNLEFKKISINQLAQINKINVQKLGLQMNAGEIPVLSGFMFAANGVPIKITNTTLQNQKIEILPATLPLKPTLTGKGFFDLILSQGQYDEKTISSIVTDVSYDYSVRRLFSLFAILFMRQLYFSIGINSDFAYEPKLLISPLLLDDQAKYQMIKNWLAWTIFIEYSDKISNIQLFLYRTKLMNALALRRPESILNFLFINNRFDDAQVVVNLEDDQYRAVLDKVNIKVSPELQNILDEKLNQFKCESWLLQLGLVSWYFKKTSFENNLQIIIKNIDFDKQQELSCQLRLFQLFSVKQYLKAGHRLYLPIEPNEQEISCYWFMSNRMSFVEQQQQIFYRNRTYLYEFYRNSLMQKLLDICIKKKHQELMKIIVQEDNYISSQEKSIFIKSVIIQANIYDSTYDIQFYKESEADKLLKEKNYFQALEIYISLKEWNSKVIQKIHKIITLPQLLTNYKKQVSLRLKNILIQKQQNFRQIILVLRLNTDEPLNAVSLNRILQLISGKSRFSQLIDSKSIKFITNRIYDRILQNFVLKNALLSDLINNKQLFTQMKILLPLKQKMLEKIQTSM